MTGQRKWKQKAYAACENEQQRRHIQTYKGAKQKLKRLLDRGGLACGFSTDRWTLQRVQELIQREFAVNYHPNYLNRLLAKLGFSPQKPLPKDVEQERELVLAWLEQDFPRLKQVAAARRRAHILG